MKEDGPPSAVRTAAPPELKPMPPYTEPDNVTEDWACADPAAANTIELTKNFFIADSLNKE
ncbi:hypothetical protein D3C86_1649910 [compost metagenome]